MADEPEDSPAPLQLAKGNPEAFARFAAGVTYELNDEDAQAIAAIRRMPPWPIRPTSRW